MPSSSLTGPYSTDLQDGRKTRKSRLKIASYRSVRGQVGGIIPCSAGGHAYRRIMYGFVGDSSLEAYSPPIRPSGAPF
ncbi:unnamed protein product [Protopolystoma xenopodis]|uniref:Uncharacterized protein n=1 Tax=Protopolystoma xenopodis TaxID=117903 RepID=A0A448WLC7_9PLAT|nr:unnamed protein product [Protopolystoma xenopodis]